MRTSRLLRAVFCVALIQGGIGAAQTPSEAVQWLRRTDIEKSGYIDGLCDSFKAFPNAPEGEMTCKPYDSKIKPVLRFCNARWAFKDGSVDDSPGILVFDEFYIDKNHSDLPSWTVITAYNDKACGESRVLPRLTAMQAKLRCFRQLTDMTLGNFPAAAVAAQDAACRSMK